jgi:hypothetical protein
MRFSDAGACAEASIGFIAHKHGHITLNWAAASPQTVFGVVEAAGVEPASEKAHRAKPTCVSGSGISAAPYKTGKSESRLVRLISAP